MERRTYLKACVAAVAAGAVQGASASQKGIQLHVDLTVDPAKEQEMLKNFHGAFKAAASKQPGYIDAQMLKLRQAVAGHPPAEANYRFVLTFQNEELRQKWVATPTHQKLWPTIENTLQNKNYNVLLYDVA